MDEKKKETVRIKPSSLGDEKYNSDRHCRSLLSPKKEPQNISRIVSENSGPKEEFAELISCNLKLEGFDEISSRIVAVLFIEPEELSLEEISIETGYSLSAVSTAMKNLSQYHIVKRFKKPSSKKAFFYLDKNLSSIGAQALRMKYDNIILPSKKILPSIIKKYEYDESGKNKISETELEIAIRYYRQILKIESVVGKFLHEMDSIDLDED